MMKFQITTKLNDGLAEAPPLKIEIRPPGGMSYHKLLAAVAEELFSDDDSIIGVGATITIERLA